NNVIANNHFRKKWQFRVKTWFNQPARKVRRRAARADKAKSAFPRPAAGSLKPIVRGQTVKYNTKTRMGKGFTLEELKEAGIPMRFAPTIGIAVDHRRKNRSVEGLQANVQRLKTYRSSLVIFPRRAEKPKAFEAAADAIKTATQKMGTIAPVTAVKHTVELMKITPDMKAAKAYAKLRLERMNKRQIGPRLQKLKVEAAKKDE
ncbi:TPA: ribosomal protein L13e, partial [Escherichia coli]|nr:ribosomal protein L13e [Escherichia coli]